MVEEEDNAMWEDQETEMETLKCIYVEEELTIKREKPYNFEILIHSNTETEERDYLKLKLIFDLPEGYPNEIPWFRIKNLSPDYIDNNALEVFENEMRERANESLGQMMIFELADLLKEKIMNINEVVLDKLDKIVEAESISNANQNIVKSDMTKLNFTPVNAETFAIWCEQYKEKIALERAKTLTGNEDKPTGRELFEQNTRTFDDIVLDDEEAETDDAEESKAAGDAVQDEEEVKNDDDAEDSDEVEFVYDRALYDADGLDEDEDVDFDDDD